MNYYLVVIESKVNPSKNLVSMCRSDEVLHISHPKAIISLINKYLLCFLENELQENIGKISIYNLTTIIIDFTNSYPTGSTYEEEDLITGESYPVIVYSRKQYSTLNEGFLIKQWSNYADFLNDENNQI